MTASPTRRAPVPLPRRPPKAYFVAHHRTDEEAPVALARGEHRTYFPPSREAQLTPRERQLQDENRQLHHLLAVCYEELRVVNELIEIEEAMRVEAEEMVERKYKDFMASVPDYRGRRSNE